MRVAMINLRTLALGIFIGVFVVLAFVISNAQAEVPKDAVIKVFDSKGKQIGEMSRSEYKVVKLNTSTKAKLEYVYVDKPLKYYDSLVLGAGAGPEQVVGHNGSAFTVQEKLRPVAEAGLCRTKGGSGLCGTVSSDASFRVKVLFPIGSGK